MRARGCMQELRARGWRSRSYLYLLVSPGRREAGNPKKPLQSPNAHNSRDHPPATPSPAPAWRAAILPVPIRAPVHRQLPELKAAGRRLDGIALSPGSPPSGARLCCKYPDLGSVTPSGGLGLLTC